MQPLIPNIFCNKCADTFPLPHECGKDKPISLDQAGSVPDLVTPAQVAQMSDEEVVRRLKSMGLDPAQQAERLERLIKGAIDKNENIKSMRKAFEDILMAPAWQGASKKEILEVFTGTLQDWQGGV